MLFLIKNIQPDHKFTARISVPKHPVDVEMLYKRSGQVRGSPKLAGFNICTKFHCNPSPT